MQTKGLITIDEEASDPAYGSEPHKRSISDLLEYGIIPLDKPRGPTSHEVVAWVRRMLELKRAGHSGTLDPYVSGLLPIGLGQATKALALLLLFPKEYWAIMRLHSSVASEMLNDVIEEFRGEIYQRPPQRSSVKRETRTRTIYELDVVEQQGNLFLLRCLCQAGTYVRKLVYDMGEVLGVGATMVELRRTRVGPLRDDGELVTLHDLNDALYRLREGDEAGIRRAVKPVEDCLKDVKMVMIRDSAVEAICHGARLAVPGITSLSPGVSKGEVVVILSGKGEIVAIGEALMTTKEIQEASRGLAFSVRRVIMMTGTYPKLWKKGQAPRLKDSG